MTALYKFLLRRRIRLGKPLSLIFFALLFAGCRQKEDKQLSLFWEEGKAAGIVIPQSLLESSGMEVIKNNLQVRLQKTDVAIFGDFQLVTNNNVLFRPLVPLFSGRQYDVFFNQKFIGSIMVPVPDARDAPELVAIYPSADTLPENLLKIYLQFSSPMREGEALQHLHLLNDKGDTIPATFLDLQPELWNEEGTTLTVWLDPGRIKRDLVPNQRMGNPLQAGGVYSIRVDSSWKNTQGLSLKQSFKKNFFVGGRDGASPQLNNWTLLLPEANTLQPLQLDFKEPLDYFLLKETVQVLNEKGAVVEGNISITDNESGLQFIPAKPWQKGRYRLQVASYLEDLAGNNLNRLFDRDILLQKKREGAFVEREFVIGSK